MQRRHDAAHPLHDLLSRRWSPRSFAPQPVEPQKLQSILEAARWSPSSSNEQPWHFIIATRDRAADFERILETLVSANQAWAKAAPVLMITVASRAFQRNQSPNRHAFYDVGQAVAHMTIQALDLGLYVHQMAGFSPDKAREFLAIPESAEAVTAIALGYLADPQALPEPYRQREITPSPRKPLSDFVFEGKWGNPAPWQPAAQ